MIEPHELGQPIARLCRVWSPIQCKSPAVLSANGFDLPFCEAHLRMLPRDLFDELVVCSTVSVWDMARLSAAHAHLRACQIAIRRAITTGHP